MLDRQYHTIIDLRAWSRVEPSLGVVGCPVRHSASPAMHNAGFAALPGFESWHYYRFEIEDKDLMEALELFSRKNFVGLNLTLPHKTAAYHLIDNRDGSASRVQAANTLLYDWPGSGTSPEAFSTDGHGLLQALQNDLSFDPNGKTILILGAGGAGQTAAVTCEDAGAVVLWQNRTRQKVAELIPCLELTRTMSVELDEVDWGQIDLVVNATSAGLGDKPGSPLNFSKISGAKPGLCAYDMLYGKQKTAFVASASACGIPVADGLSMLLHQGAKAFEIWTKQKAPLEIMSDALKKAIYGIQ